MKLGIIIDSSAGLTEKEAHAQGLGFLPLYLTMDGTEYADGITITANKFYKIANIEMETKTSATPPGIINQIFKKFTKQYDHVIVYTISKALSSQQKNIKVIAKKYPNIHVIDSYNVGPSIMEDIANIKQLNQQGKNIAQIVKIANTESEKWFGIVAPKSLKWLVKGGRVSPGVAAMANLLKIIPLIKLEHGALDKFGKGRVFHKAVIKSGKAVAQKTGADKCLIYVGEIEKQTEIVNSLKKIFKHVKIFPMPAIIATHTGPNVIGIVAKKS